MGKLQTNLTLGLIDRVTSPLKRVNEGLADMNRKAFFAQAPVRALGKNLRIFAEESGMNRLHKQAGKVGTALGGVGASLGSLGLKLGAAAGIGGYAVKQLVDTAAQFENYQAVLETTEGSATKAKQALAWVSTFAAKTPYEVADVTAAFVKLRAYGIDPIAGDALRSMGDAASAMGKPLEQAVEAVADAVTGQWERLKEFGIKAETSGNQARLAYTDRDGKQRVKVVDKTNRALIQSNLLAIWNERYAGAMDRQSKTWSGQVSNLSDVWTRFKLSIMQGGLFEWMNTKLGHVLTKLDQWQKNGQLDVWAKRVGDKLQNAFLWAEVQLPKAIAGVEKLATATVYLVDKLGGADNALLAVLAVVSAPAVMSVLNLAGAFAQLTWAIAPVLASLGPLLINPVTILIAGFGAWYYAITQLHEHWSELVGDLGGIWKGFVMTVSDGVTSIMDRLSFLKYTPLGYVMKKSGLWANPEGPGAEPTTTDRSGLFNNFQSGVPSATAGMSRSRTEVGGQVNIRLVSDKPVQLQSMSSFGGLDLGMTMVTP